MTIPGNEEVRYDIIIDAKAALKALQELMRLTASNDEKILRFTNVVQQAAKKWGVSWQYALGVFKQLNAELSKQHKATLFGQTGGKNLMDMSESYLRAADSARAYKDKVEEVDKSQKKAEQSAHGFRRSLDVVRIALGTIVAMAIFRFFNFLEESFRKMMEVTRQLEMSLYQLRNAEQSLSEAGIEITPEDFESLIKSLKELFPYLSKIDLTRMVSQVSLLTKDLGLTRNQLEDLITAIPVMAQRAGITIEQATQQVVNGLANSGRGWKDLGIIVDAAVIRQEAVSAGLVESADAYNKLTAEQQQQVDVLALLSILDKSVENELQNQSEYLDTVDSKTRAASAAWEDFLTVLGTAGAPVIKLVLDLIVMLIQGLQVVTGLIQIWAVNTGAAIFSLGEVIREFVHGNIKSIDDLMRVYKSANEYFQQNAYGAMGGPILPVFGTDRFIPQLGDDTSTASIQGLQDDLDSLDTTKAQEEIEDLLKDLEKLDQKEVKINAEFIEKDLREAENHATDMSRAEEDYQIKRARYIADSNDDIAEKNRQYREKEKNDEAKFQEELRQLRERFLFDLEDALRERDARQVLRLQEKYRMDKQAMINEHNLKKKDDAQAHADDIAKAKKDRADKLKQMDEDHRLEMQRREEDYQLERQRRLEDHEQELEDLRRQREERMQEAAAAIAEELGIKGDGVRKIYEILSKFYGPGGVFDGLYDYTNRSMVAGAQDSLNAIVAIYAQALAMIAGLGGVGKAYSGVGGQNKPGTGTGGKSGNIGKQALGGTYLATGPTRAVFGESGPELATFIPLGRSGASVGANRGIVGSGSGGKVDIQLLLSPDLEARIMNNTLDEAANVVLKVVESK